MKAHLVLVVVVICISPVSKVHMFCVVEDIKCFGCPKMHLSFGYPSHHRRRNHAANQRLFLKFQVVSQEAQFRNRFLFFGGCFFETGVRRKPCVAEAGFASPSKPFAMRQRNAKTMALRSRGKTRAGLLRADFARGRIIYGQCILAERKGDDLMPTPTWRRLPKFSLASQKIRSRNRWQRQFSAEKEKEGGLIGSSPAGQLPIL